VLGYHGVEKKIIDTRIQKVHIPLRLFERHIRFLRNNYDIISVDYLWDCLEHGYKLNPSQLLITFDDGYKNNLNIVAPIMKAYEIPFTVFLSTKQIQEGSRLPTYYLRAAIIMTEHNFIELPSIKARFYLNTEKQRLKTMRILTNILKSSSKHVVDGMVADFKELLPHSRWQELNALFYSESLMSWDDARKMTAFGAIMGSHSHGHVIFNKRQSRKIIISELKESKKIIEKNLGGCKYIAYPSGDKHGITADLIRHTREAGYLLAFTTIPGEIIRGCNRLMLPRIMAEVELDVLRFILQTLFFRKR